MLGEVHIRTAVVESVNQVRSKGNEIIDPTGTATDLILFGDQRVVMAFHTGTTIASPD
jgi:hypothetical protein